MSLPAPCANASATVPALAGRVSAALTLSFSSIGILDCASMRFGAVLIWLLLCTPCAAAEFFPSGRAFPEPVADPRGSRFGFDWVESGRVSGRAGRSVALVRDGAFDVRIDGMLWAWLRQTPGFNFPLETIAGQ